MCEHGRYKGPQTKSMILIFSLSCTDDRISKNHGTHPLTVHLQVSDFCRDTTTVPTPWFPDILFGFFFPGQVKSPKSFKGDSFLVNVTQIFLTQ